LICDRLSKLITKYLTQELVASQDGSVFSDGTDQAKVEEHTNVLVSNDLVVVVGNNCILGLIFVKEFLPVFLKASDSLRKLLEEEVVLVAKLVFGESDYVEPDLLVHPVVLLVTVINTRTGLEEDANISTGQQLRFDHNLEGHHQLECDLVSFEQASVYVSVHFAGHRHNNVMNTVLDCRSLG